MNETIHSQNGAWQRWIPGERPVQSTIRSARVSLRKQHYYIHPLAGSKGGDPVLFMEPVIKLEENVEPAVLGESVMEAIRLSHHDAPSPTNWKNFSAPLLKAADVKSESAFMKGSLCTRVDVDGEDVIVFTTTSNQYKNASAPTGTIKGRLASPHELGLMVIQALAQSD